MNANDNNGRNQILTINHLIWGTSFGWLESGEIYLNSTLLLTNDDALNWNIVNKFNYGGNYYAVFTRNTNPLGIENFLSSGNGRYGGNFYKWYMIIINFVIF